MSRTDEIERVIVIRRGGTRDDITDLERDEYAARTEGGDARD